MFSSILQIFLSVVTMFLATVELREKFRKRSQVSKREARVSLWLIILIAIICMTVQVQSCKDNQNDKNELVGNFTTLKNNNKILKTKIGSLEDNIDTLTNQNIKLITLSKVNLNKTISEINSSASSLNTEIKRNADIQKAANDYLTGVKNIPIFRIYAEEISTSAGNRYILHPVIDNWGKSPLYEAGFLMHDTIPSRHFFVGTINFRAPDINCKIYYPMEKDSLEIQCGIYWRGGTYYCYATAKKFGNSVKVKNTYYMTGKNLFKQFNPLESPYIKIPRPANYSPPKDKNGKILKDIPDITSYQ